jgi:hypothetical protein
MKKNIDTAERLNRAFLDGYVMYPNSAMLFSRSILNGGLIPGFGGECLS